MILIFAIFLPFGLRKYSTILLLMSISIVFTTVGCEWIFNIYEDFAYITIRSIVFQIVSMVLLFAFVKTENDLVTYVLISVIASSGANVFNAISRRRYCSIKIILNRKIFRHICPILILFGNTVATTIYVNSDMTMVGIFAGTYFAGLYSVATKLYFIIKNMLSAIIIVSIPRLSAYLKKNDKIGFEETARKIISSLILIVTPVVVGLISISRNAILIIAGKEYVSGTLSLQILSIALLFCLFSWFYTSCVLIPNNQEKKVLMATIVASSVNIILNIILIPFWKHDAAAFTTVLAEFVSMVICYYYGKEYFRFKIAKKDIISVLIGNISIFLICRIILLFIPNIVYSTILCIIVSVIVYGIIVVLMGNSSIVYLIGIIKSKFRKSA